MWEVGCSLGILNSGRGGRRVEDEMGIAGESNVRGT